MSDNWFFGVFDFLQKNERKQVVFMYHSSKVDFFCSFLEENEDIKKHFEIISPLTEACTFSRLSGTDVEFAVINWWIL